jgi:hypothetical protein
VKTIVAVLSIALAGGGAMYLWQQPDPVRQPVESAPIASAPVA